MAFSDEQLRAKAEGFVAAFSKMTAKQREQSVTTIVVNDYNNLRALIIEAKPELERLLPPKLEMIEGMGIVLPNARYQDIHAFCEQIVAILRPSAITLGPRR
jgi:hypothetical protein